MAWDRFDSQHPVHGDRRRFLISGASSALLAGCATGGAPTGGPAAGTYATAMREALRSATGALPNYQFRSSPVGNFGVGSIYIDEIAGNDLRQAESSWFLGGPDNWLARSLPPAERQRWRQRLVSEGSMGAINIDSSGSRDLHLQAGIALVSALTVNVGLDATRGIDTRLQANEVLQRRLNWAEFQAALNAGQIAPEVADVVRRGRFVIVAADVVLTGYRADISIDESRSPAIAAGLRTNLLPPSRIGGNAGFRVAESARGHFVVLAPQPVVAAVLFKRPPPVSKDLYGGLPVDLDAWPTAGVSEKAVAAVEAELLRKSGSRSFEK